MLCEGAFPALVDKVVKEVEMNGENVSIGGCDAREFFLCSDNISFLADISARKDSLKIRMWYGIFHARDIPFEENRRSLFLLELVYSLFFL